jgi:hypothetical protein
MLKVNFTYEPINDILIEVHSGLLVEKLLQATGHSQITVLMLKPMEADITL